MDRREGEPIGGVVGRMEEGGSGLPGGGGLMGGGGGGGGV